MVLHLSVLNRVYIFSCKSVPNIVLFDDCFPVTRSKRPETFKKYFEKKKMGKKRYFWFSLS